MPGTVARMRSVGDDDVTVFDAAARRRRKALWVAVVGVASELMLVAVLVVCGSVLVSMGSPVLGGLVFAGAATLSGYMAVFVRRTRRIIRTLE